MRMIAGILALLSASCTLLFAPEETPQDDEYIPVICEGQARVYDRGTMLAENRYRHIDYRQGTITFWVRALKPIEGPTLLLELSGIRVAASTDGLFLKMGGSGDYSVLDLTWEPGVDHFVTLRWDSKLRLSGSGSRNSQIEITVDKKPYLFANDAPYTPAINTVDSFIAIGGQGRFQVDQLVIYSRPLFMNDDISDQSDLFLMGESKSDSGRFSQGGFDVLFASASPRNDTCENFKARAWALPMDDLLASDVQQGNFDKWGGATPQPLPPVSQVYPDGGFSLGIGLTLSAIVDVQRETSYSLEVVNHAFATTGHARIEVASVAAATSLVSYEGVTADRENPERAILTFDTSSSDTQVEISVTAVGDFLAFDSIVLRPNLLSSAGFDEGELAEDGPWGLDIRDTAGPVVFDDLTPFAGAYSACLAALDGPSTFTQAPPSELLLDHEFYLFGAEFLWRDGYTPGVGIGNGSFFATGVPYEAERKAGASSYERLGWQLVGTAARRLQDSQHNNHNDIVRFGSLQNGEGRSSDYCVDSAYTLKLDRIDGFVSAEL